MDGPDISYRHPAGNLSAALGSAADAVFAGTRSTDLLLCIKNNSSGIQAQMEKLAAFQPVTARTRHTDIGNQGKHQDRRAYLCYINLS